MVLAQKQHVVLTLKKRKQDMNSSYPLKSDIEPENGVQKQYRLLQVCFQTPCWFFGALKPSGHGCNALEWGFFDTQAGLPNPKKGTCVTSAIWKWISVWRQGISSGTYWVLCKFRLVYHESLVMLFIFPLWTRVEACPQVVDTIYHIYYTGMSMVLSNWVITPI